jgi:NAD-reducing hydrogenase large subunit
MMRKFGQELIKATAGKKIHGTGAIPGGSTRTSPSPSATRSSKTSTRCSSGRAARSRSPRTTPSRHLEEVSDFGVVRLEPPVAVREDGAMDLYHGNLRAITSTGETIFDHVDYQGYLDTSSRRSGPGRT